MVLLFFKPHLDQEPPSPMLTLIPANSHVDHSLGHR